jgi:cytochrome c553
MTQFRKMPQSVKGMAMKKSIFKVAVLACFTALPVASAHAQSEAMTLAKKYCGWCHGASLQGYAIAPQLAGQNRRYIEDQVRYFKGKTRNNPYSQRYMWHAAMKISPENLHIISAYVSSLQPEAADNGQKELVAKGRQIFLVGQTKSNLVACVFCHGPKGQGRNFIPRIGGQSYDYLKRRLDQWNEGYHQSAKHMPGIAIQLNPDQVKAVASYLSFVK